jgi:hypothetical protein
MQCKSRHAERSRFSVATIGLHQRKRVAMSHLLLIDVHKHPSDHILPATGLTSVCCLPHRVAVMSLRMQNRTAAGGGGEVSAEGVNFTDPKLSAARIYIEIAVSRLSSQIPPADSGLQTDWRCCQSNANSSLHDAARALRAGA